MVDDCFLPPGHHTLLLRVFGQADHDHGADGAQENGHESHSGPEAGASAMAHRAVSTRR